MKGFPNQIASLPKLATAMRCIEQLLADGQNPRSDGVLGEALVRAEVAGTGHSKTPVEEYIKEQRKKALGDQSFRTTARGLKELFRLFGLLENTKDRVVVTPLGHQAAAFDGQPLDVAQRDFWRRLIRNFRHYGKDDTASHPYQVLLRLIARKPGISKIKCALALEARDDSPEELERIVGLADRDAETVRRELGVSTSNWANAVKVLPKIATDLQDIIEGGTRANRTYRIADAPGRAVDVAAPPPPPPPGPGVTHAAPRPPRSARAVSADTIATAGLADREEAPVPPDIDPFAMAAAIRTRQDRLRRHNILVREIAERLADAGMALFEDPFDILALHRWVGVMVEAKTLDGTEPDERDRVQEVVAQLLYYGSFVAGAVAGEATVHKIACFESPITPAHMDFLAGLGIGTIWKADGRLCANAKAAGVLAPYLEELR